MPPDLQKLAADAADYGDTCDAGYVAHVADFEGNNRVYLDNSSGKPLGF